jgi:hypothetical protein
MSAFYRRQAEQLARHGELRLAFLRVGGEPIAFAYGMQTKGVYRSLKVGYDPHWSAYSPGQMLRMLVLERLFAEPDTRQVDAISPTPAHRQWRPEPYEIGRLLIATGGWPGTIAVRAARAWGGA